ncbi:MAG: glucosamine-6-phosphate deaminase [Clostridia bacterium]|nr:glucosamine-6-phosphate deaminase [Clostridia bacterium]
MTVIKYLKKDKFRCFSFASRAEMGDFAAEDIASEIKRQLAYKPEINMIFAAAPSQNDVLSSLTARTDVEWGRINAFHMDEYIGLPADAPQGFGNFLKNAIFGKVPFKSVNLINSTAADPEAECARYSALLAAHKCDIIVMGIGENGHIAFNDPHVADFRDKKAVKTVSLDEVCRMQQVNDGCFAHIDEVPEYALTLTVPTLVAPEAAFCIVPAKTKAWAVNRTLNGAIGEECPATALRLHDNARLYLDPDSSSLL